MGSGANGAGANKPGGGGRPGAERNAGRGGGPGAERDADWKPNMLSPVRYLAWLYSPVSQQPAFAALCAIESEVAASLRPGIDHHVAHARLQWWRDEAERSARGQAVHPLTRELVKAYADGCSVAPGAGGASSALGAPSSERASRSRGLRFPDTSGFVDTAVWDLASATFETRRELTAYCERWAAAMFETAAAVAAAHAAASDHAVESTHSAPSGYLAPTDRSGRAGRSGQSAPTGQSAPDRSAFAGDASMALEGEIAEPGSTPSQWRTLGAAVREIELLANLGPEAYAGRLRVPLDELERAGVDPKAVPKPPWPAPLAALLAQRHAALRAVIANGVVAIASEAQASYRGLLVWAALAWRMSLRAEGALPGMIAPGPFHALTDAWQAWRAARRATTGTFRLS